jgi:hypothetical protein
MATSASNTTLGSPESQLPDAAAQPHGNIHRARELAKALRESNGAYADTSYFELLENIIDNDEVGVLEVVFIDERLPVWARLCT